VVDAIITYTAKMKVERQRERGGEEEGVESKLRWIMFSS